jgi:Transport protein particle (TRAPP) complex subunit
MKRLSIYEKNFKSKKEVSSSAFFFLFSEIVQYCIKKDRQDLEKQLEEMGYPLGARFLELIVFRDKGSKKRNKHSLNFIIHQAQHMANSL